MKSRFIEEKEWILVTILLNVVRSFDDRIVMVKFDLKDGSSKHGKARRAYPGYKWILLVINRKKNGKFTSNCVHAPVWFWFVVR
jgi:hypothetical protein